MRQILLSVSAAVLLTACGNNSDDIAESTTSDPVNLESQTTEPLSTNAVERVQRRLLTTAQSFGFLN